jgi:hypothetical protein
VKAKEVLLYIPWLSTKVRASSRVRVSPPTLIFIFCSEDWKRERTRKEGDGSTSPTPCPTDPARCAEEWWECEEGVAVVVGWRWEWREWEFWGRSADISLDVDLNARPDANASTSTSTSFNPCRLYLTDSSSYPSSGTSASANHLSFIIFCTSISFLPSNVIFT